MFSDIFTQLGDMALTALGRVNKEYAEFLADYRRIVETVPSEVAAMFGSLKVSIVKDGEPQHDWGVELTATDYLFWKNEIEGGTRLVKGPKVLRRRMLEHMTKQIETVPLEPKERKALIALMDKA